MGVSDVIYTLHLRTYGSGARSSLTRIQTVNRRYSFPPLCIPNVSSISEAVQAHHATAFGLPQLLFRNHKLRQHPFQTGADGLHAAQTTRVLPEHTSGVQVLQRSPRVSVEPSSTRVERMILEVTIG